MVIKFSWKPVVDDLFENDDEMVHQIFVFKWFFSHCVLKIVKSTSHDTWFFITKSLLHFDIHLINWRNHVKFNKDHDGLLPDDFMIVIQQSCDIICDSELNTLIT